MEQNLYIKKRNEGFVALSFENIGLGCERRGYLDYKIGKNYHVSEERIFEFEILKLLEKLGLSDEEIGTYLYKDVIMKSIKFLKKNKEDKEKYNKLYSELKQQYSQFYFDIARNELEMGITTFHEHIKTAFSNINYKNADLTLVYSIFDKLPIDISIEEKTFILVNYIYDNMLNYSNEPRKKRVLSNNI